MSRISEAYIRRLIKEAVINEVEKAEKLSQAAEDVIRQLSLTNDTGDNVIARAKKYAKGKPFTYVRDVGDEYIYAAIGGNLTTDNFAPEYFVCVHDGARKDRATLGYKFVPGDKGYRPTKIDDFIAVDPAEFSNMSNDAIQGAMLAAQALRNAYGDMNTYQYIVFKVKNKQLPAAELIAQTPPANEPPAAQTPEAVSATVAVAPGVSEGSGEADLPGDDGPTGDGDGSPGKPKPTDIVNKPKPRPWWKIKFPDIPWFRRGKGKGGDDDGGGSDRGADRQRDKDRRRADKERRKQDRIDSKESDKRSAEAWKRIWEDLTRDEKKIFAAAVKKDPNVSKMIADAVKRGAYRDFEMRQALTGAYSDGGVSFLDEERYGIDSRLANNMQYFMVYGDRGDEGLIGRYGDKGYINLVSRSTEDPDIARVYRNYPSAAGIIYYASDVFPPKTKEEIAGTPYAVLLDLPRVSP
jgi:hypothetical protein